METPTGTPNPTPAPASTEPAGGAPVEPTKPIMGTTPGGHRNTPEPTTPAPTTTPEGGNGTEGGQQPTTTPENNGQGDDPTKPVEPTDVDYKTKFSESSQEAQRLLKVLQEAGLDPKTGQPIAPTGDTPTPTRMEPEGVPQEPTPQPTTTLTDDQLAQAIPGFHNLSDAEKTMLRDTKATVRQMAEMQKLVTEMYDERMYNQQVKDLTSKEEWKVISEHAEEFKEFSYKDENLKVPLETLAASFLYTKGLATKPAEKPATPPPSGVEPGSGGGVEGSGKTEKGFSTEEIAQIRKTDPKRYAKLAREGKLKVRS